MKTENFTYRFKTSKKAKEIFQLLLNVEKWWSGQFGETIQGESKKVNDEFEFKAGGGMHYTKQKLVELNPNKRVVWLVTESKLTFLSDASEWKGTRIGFDISETGDKTEVTFTHDGLVPQFECYKECSTGWTKYLDELKRQVA